MIRAKRVFLVEFLVHFRGVRSMSGGGAWGFGSGRARHPSHVVFSALVRQGDLRNVGAGAASRNAQPEDSRDQAHEMMELEHAALYVHSQLQDFHVEVMQVLKMQLEFHVKAHAQTQKMQLEFHVKAHAQTQKIKQDFHVTVHHHQKMQLEFRVRLGCHEKADQEHELLDFHVKADDAMSHREQDFRTIVNDVI